MQKVRPTVVIDPELRRIVKHIDLDIDAYIQYLYDQGLNSGQVKSIKIYFTATGRFLSAGIYNFKTHKIQISVPRARDVNKLLVHETHHAVEGMLGQISSTDRLANYIFNVGVYAGTAILALAAAWNLFVNASQPSNFLHLSFGLGVVLFLIGGIAYIANPAERRAYSVRTPPIPFVRVVKRPLRQQLVGIGQMFIAIVLRKNRFPSSTDSWLK